LRQQRPQVFQTEILPALLMYVHDSVENTLLRSGETRRRIPSQEEQPVQDFGRNLLQALLVGEVRTRYAMSLHEATKQGLAPETAFNH
jgi:hypothetical protein